MTRESTPAPKFIRCLGPSGFHRIAYREWGDPAAARTLICAHGLTQNGLAFDRFATALADQYRVICPDVLGRGESDWTGQVADYDNAVYLADMATLLACLDADSVDWVGSSMGGLLGMLLAAQRGSPVRKLALVDVGPLLPASAMPRIDSYVGRGPDFETFDQAIEYVRQTQAGMGRLDDADWHHVTGFLTRPKPDGGYRLAYDPVIGAAFRQAGEFQDIDLWPLWDRIECPVLALRGEESDIFLADTAQQMLTRGPDCTLVELPEVGHPPPLLDGWQIGIVRDWLLSWRRAPG